MVELSLLSGTEWVKGKQMEEVLTATVRLREREFVQGRRKKEK
jgi:hypothetical protein